MLLAQGAVATTCLLQCIAPDVVRHRPIQDLRMVDPKVVDLAWNLSCRHDQLHVRTHIRVMTPMGVMPTLVSNEWGVQLRSNGYVACTDKQNTFKGRVTT